MEREGTGMKYMAANSEGRQSPPRAVELRKKVIIQEKSRLQNLLVEINWHLSIYSCSV
jgi:hypothetical protein